MNRDYYTVFPHNPAFYPFAYWGGGKVRVFFLRSVPQFPKDHCSVEDSQASPVRPSGNSNVEIKMTTGRMILTEKNQSTGRKPSSSATLSITRLPCTDLGPKPGFRNDRPAINNLS